MVTWAVGGFGEEATDGSDYTDSENAKRSHFWKRQDEQDEQDGGMGFYQTNPSFVASFVCIRGSTENYQTNPPLRKWAKRDSDAAESRLWNLPNEPMRSARQFKVPGSRFKVVEIYETKPTKGRSSATDRTQTYTDAANYETNPSAISVRPS
jgi:hypothetical protein